MIGVGTPLITGIPSGELVKSPFRSSFVIVWPVVVEFFDVGGALERGEEERLILAIVEFRYNHRATDIGAIPLLVEGLAPYILKVVRPRVRIPRSILEVGPDLPVEIICAVLQCRLDLSAGATANRMHQEESMPR